MPLSTWLRRWSWLVATLLCAALPSHAQADGAPTLAPAEQPRVSRPAGDTPDLPRIEGGRCYWHDQPVLLSWAFGLRDPGDLDRYVKCGFNTVYIDLLGEPTVDTLARTLAEEAGRRGLAVIVGLNVANALGGPITVGDENQTANAQAWLARTVEAWRDLKCVVAWGLQHDAEERLVLPTAQFATFLAEQYRDDTGLHAAWGRELPPGAPRTPELAATLDLSRPGGIGRASIDVARWEAFSLVWLLRDWTRAIQAADPSRPVLGGRMSRGRQLLVAPDTLSGVQPSLVAPGGRAGLPPDPYELASLASQTGRYATFVCLDASADATLWRPQARRAAARGISGLSWLDWPTLAAEPGRQRLAWETLDELGRQDVAAFEQRGCSAVVLSPWTRGPATYGAGWYGYGTVGGDEPAGLLSLLRGGSKFGPLDVLTPRDLAAVGADGTTSTRRVDLARYGCVFLPAAYFLEGQAVTALSTYVQGGGIVLADYGVGSDGFRGVETRLPPALADLFGVVPRLAKDVFEVALDPALRARMRRLRPGEDPLSLLPEGAPGPGALVISEAFDPCPDLRLYDTVGARAGRQMLLAPALFVTPGAETRTIGLQAQIGARYPTQAASAGLFARPVGHGIAMLASAPLWAAVDRGDPLYEPLHMGLLRGRSPLRTVLDVGPDQATWAARGEDHLWLERRAGRAGLVAVDLPEIEGRVYPGGINVLRRAQKTGQAGGAPLVNRYVTRLEPAELHCLAAAPMTLWPLGPAAGVQLTAYGPEGVEFWVQGGGGDIAWRDGLFMIDASEPNEVLITLASGAYRIEPGSLHRIEVRREQSISAEIVRVPDGSTSRPSSGVRAQTTEWHTVNADPDGRLTLHDTLQLARVRIKPAAARWDD